MDEYILRRDSSTPYQDWKAFPAGAVVQIENAYGDNRIGLDGDFWWGYETECGQVGEGVIMKARRIDKPLVK